MRVYGMASALLLLGSSMAQAASVGELIQSIQSVGKNGEGHPQAVQAVQELQQADAAALPQIVKAFKDATPLTANWLRSAFETVADRAIKQNQSLPVEELLMLVKDQSQDPRARRMTYEWLVKVKPELREELIPQLLKDRSSEFRRDAVARLLEAAEKIDLEKEGEKAKELYQQALSGAVDKDQVDKIVQSLKGLDVEINLPQHFGFLTNWKVIGPFDNKGLIGFAKVYPPEQELKPNASYQGQEGEVTWQDVVTKDNYGLLDIGKQLKNYKGSCMYATTEFVAADEQDVQFRLGTPNAWKLWVNGELVFAREEYHRGTAMDQYQVNVHLKQGTNVILFKVCQNEQTEDWAQSYQFQIRVCDVAGSAILSGETARTSQLNNSRQPVVAGKE